MSVAEMQMHRLYRDILKAARSFPSIKRKGLIQDIKDEFRDNKNLKDPAKVTMARKQAIDGLIQLEQYSSLDKKGSDWDIQLRGACP